MALNFQRATAGFPQTLSGAIFARSVGTLSTTFMPKFSLVPIFSGSKPPTTGLIMMQAVTHV
jgi:hypothetical protein